MCFQRAMVVLNGALGICNQKSSLLLTAGNTPFQFSPYLPDDFYGSKIMPNIFVKLLINILIWMCKSILFYLTSIGQYFLWKNTILKMSCKIELFL
jgi:hypothetical protein